MFEVIPMTGWQRFLWRWFGVWPGEGKPHRCVYCRQQFESNTETVCGNCSGGQ